MKSKNFKSIKKEHEPGCSCSICGLKYNVQSFKNGYVCETCLEYIKDSYPSGTDPVKQSR